MQRVWCTKCGKENVAGCRLCGGCGDRLRPAYLDARGGEAPLPVCTVCGTVNRVGATNCEVCGTPLPGAVVGRVESESQGGRISLRPETVSPPPPASAGGGKGLSRLAQARRQKEAEGRLSSSSGDSADWLGGLRSDAPPPPEYATGMDEDDEADPTLSAALEELRQADAPPPASVIEPPSFERQPSFEERLSGFEEKPPAPFRPSFAVPPPPPPLPEPPQPSFQAAPSTPFNPIFGDLGDDTSLPDWLQNSPSPSPSSAAQADSSGANESSGGMPDWLRELAGPGREGGASQAPSPALPPENPAIGRLAEPDSGEVPDWLSELKSEMQGSGPASKPPANPPPSSEVPDWLREGAGGLPASPAFGDIEVEERLSFAFDEPERLPPARLGQILPATPAQSEQASTDLDALPPLPFEDGPANFGTSDLAFLPDLPALPDPASPEQADRSSFDMSLLADLPDPAPTGGTSGLNLPPLSDFEAEFGAFEPSTQGQNAWVDALPPLPDFSPEAEAAQAATYSDDEAFSSSLVPWLQGLRPPALDTEADSSNFASLPDLPDFFDLDGATQAPPMSAAPSSDLFSASANEPGYGAVFSASDFNSNSDSDSDSNSNSLVPWLQGLRPPALDTEDAQDSGVGAAAAHADSSLFLPEPERLETEEAPRIGSLDTQTDTRSFSVREMFKSTNEISDALLQKPDFDAGRPVIAPAQPLPPPEGATEVGSVVAFQNAAGQAAAFAPDDLPDWLRETTSQSQSQSQNMTLAQALSFDWAGTDLSGSDEDTEEETEMLPFSLPDFQGDPAPTEQRSKLAEFTGGLPADFELADFLQDAKPSPAPEAATQAPFPAAVPAPADPDLDMPDFLRDLGVGQAQATPSEIAASPPEAVELVFQDAATLAPGSGPVQPPSDRPESLDFLRDEAATIADPPSTGEVPPWLKALSSGTLDTPPPKAPGGYTPMGTGVSRAEEQQSELPDWLRDETAATPSDPAQAVTGADAALPIAPFEAADEGSNWLAEFSARPAPAPASAAPVFPPAADETEPGAIGSEDNDSLELPDWLRESPATASPEAGLQFAPLPDWLSDYEGAGPDLALPLDEAGAGSARPAEPHFESRLEDVAQGRRDDFSSLNLLSDIEGPAWLRGASTPAPARPAEAGAGPGQGQNAGALPDSGQVPTWLRTVKPAEAETTGGDAASLALANRLEEEEGLPQVALPPRLASAAVLTTLLSATAAPVARSAPAASAARSRSLRQVPPQTFVRIGLSLLLLAVALFGLYRPLPVTPLTVTPATQSFFDEIDGLGANAKVLVSYDWEADRSGEMNPLARAITQHVMSKRARLVTLSLNPQGPALASLVTDELARDPLYGNNGFYHYEPGDATYLNLGWRSGQEAAVRSLFDNMGDLSDYRYGRPASEYALMNGLNSLADFDLIVVLAGDEGGVRTWVEQFGVRPGSRLLFATPAAVEPLARPYAQGLPSASGELRTTEKQVRARGLLAGLNGAAQYDQLLRDKLNLQTNQNLNLQGRLSAQSLAALLLILAVVVANLYYLVRRRE